MHESDISKIGTVTVIVFVLIISKSCTLFRKKKVVFNKRFYLEPVQMEN